MPGPLPKLEGRQRAHRGEARPVVVSMSSRARLGPEPPSGLLVGSVKSWERLWASPLAATYTETDVPALARLFELRDEMSRVNRVARKSRLTAGHKAQPVLNPLLRYAETLAAEVRQLEDRFGLSPRARLTLGIQLGEAHRSLAELNAEFLEGEHDDRDE